MISRKLLCSAVVAVAFTFLSRSAIAEPAPTLGDEDFIRTNVPTVISAGGKSLNLPVGYFLPEKVYTKLDTELKRLQDVETRLGAENKSLKRDAEVYSPGWKTAGVALLAGLVAGWAVTR